MSENKEEPDYDKLQKQWEEELKTNPKVQAFLESYKQSGWEPIYRQYALNKMLAFKYADHYKKRMKNK